MSTGRLPNLLVIGAMKSGTTSLHNYLAQHPAVFMSKEKEPGFFVEELSLQRGLDWYRSLFAESSGARVIGESSTHYTKLPLYRGVPERIAAMLPDARFLYIMRDPVERAISHYWFSIRMTATRHERRFTREMRGISAALRQDPTYVAWSNYAMQLRPYIERFGRDRVLALTFEELKTSPLETLATIFRWLGVDDSFVPADMNRRWNEAPTTFSRVRGSGFLHAVRHSRAWEAIAHLAPRQLRRAAAELTVRPADRSEEPVEEAVRYLRAVHRYHVEELEDLLGRDFTEWRTLHGTDDSSPAGGQTRAAGPSARG